MAEGDGENNVRELPKGKAGSVSDRAAAAAEQTGLDVDDEAKTGEEDDGQAVFVWEQGRKVTLGTLIARGTPVEHAVVFGGKRSKGVGGLRGFGEQPILIVRGGIGPVKLVPTYDDDEKVKKVVVEQHIVAKVVNDADTDEAMALIAHILDTRGYVKRDEAA